MERSTRTAKKDAASAAPAASKKAARKTSASDAMMDADQVRVDCGEGGALLLWTLITTLAVTTQQIVVDDGLTPAERERAAIIARNRERMAELELPQLAADLAALVKPPKPAAPTQKGAGAKKRKAALDLPPRMSLRSRGVAPEGGMILHEGRDGTVVVTGGVVVTGELPEPVPHYIAGACVCLGLRLLFPKMGMGGVGLGVVD